jgi:hypothetical protein
VTAGTCPEPQPPVTHLHCAMLIRDDYFFVVRRPGPTRCQAEPPAVFMPLRVPLLLLLLSSSLLMLVLSLSMPLLLLLVPPASPVP